MVRAAKTNHQPKKSLAAPSTPPRNTHTHTSSTGDNSKQHTIGSLQLTEAVDIRNIVKREEEERGRGTHKTEVASPLVEELDDSGCGPSDDDSDIPPLI